MNEREMPRQEVVAYLWYAKCWSMSVRPRGFRSTIAATNFAKLGLAYPG